MSEQEDRNIMFDSAFAEIKKATINPADNVLVLHMWERLRGKPDTIKAMEARREEIDSLLSVMSGEEGAVYFDKGFLKEFSCEDDELAPRRVPAHSELGMIALATTTVLEDATLGVLDRGSHTGLLLLGAKPVMVLPYDGWTLCHLGEGAWHERGWRSIDHHVKTSRVHGLEYDKYAYKHFLDSPGKRKQLVDKLTAFRADKNHPLYNDIVEPQIEKGEKIGDKGHFSVDPTDDDVTATASKAYAILMEKILDNPEHYGDHKKRDENYPEVDVNATLQNAAGIVVYNDSAKDMVLPDASNLSNIIENEPHLATKLYRAIEEYEQLNAAMKAKGINKPITIVTYQPYAERGNRLVHTPPILHLKRLLEKKMKEEGLFTDIGGHAR